MQYYGTDPTTQNNITTNLKFSLHLLNHFPIHLHIRLRPIKRPERIAAHFPDDWGQGYANVWLGVSAENYDTYHEWVPYLIRIPAAVRFDFLITDYIALDLFNHIPIEAEEIEWLAFGGDGFKASLFYYISYLSNLLIWCSRVISSFNEPLVGKFTVWCYYILEYTGFPISYSTYLC